MFIMNNFSTCFGHHYDHLQENKTYVTARGVLRWFCWMWLVAVVGRCVVGCEHCAGYCSTLSTCFGHHYAHLQENKTYYCMWCAVLVLLDVVASGCGALPCGVRAL